MVKPSSVARKCVHRGAGGEPVFLCFGKSVAKRTVATRKRKKKMADAFYRDSHCIYMDQCDSQFLSNNHSTTTVCGYSSRSATPLGQDPVFPTSRDKTTYDILPYEPVFTIPEYKTLDRLWSQVGLRMPSTYVTSALNGFSVADLATARFIGFFGSCTFENEEGKSKDVIKHVVTSGHVVVPHTGNGHIYQGEPVYVTFNVCVVRDGAGPVKPARVRHEVSADKFVMRIDSKRTLDAERVADFASRIAEEIPGVRAGTRMSEIGMLPGHATKLRPGLGLSGAAVRARLLEYSIALHDYIRANDREQLLMSQLVGYATCNASPGQSVGIQLQMGPPAQMG